MVFNTLPTTQYRILMHLRYKAVKNIVRKGEIACNKQFLLFSQCFLPAMVLIFHFKCISKMSSAICFNLDQSKILSSGNGLMPFSTVFQLYRCGQCIYPCFPEVLLTGTLHNILSKPLAAFPHNLC